MNYIKGLALVLAVVALQACSQMHSQKMDYSGPEDAMLTDALANQQWIKDEYKEYQSRRGYKAFAIAVDYAEMIIATGFADDKVTKQADFDEALRMCKHFSQGDGECRVVDEQVSNGHAGLTKQQIDGAPKELIAHRDIRQYVQYTKAEAPKAFVVAACSGQSFWFEQQASKQKAEEKGLQKCELNRHDSDPCCTVLESE
tara:strand:+ start:228 stop:827 length:600 start_codon:yes stop_codon:yes gene_type:complete